MLIPLQRAIIMDKRRIISIVLLLVAFVFMFGGIFSRSCKSLIKTEAKEAKPDDVPNVASFQKTPNFSSDSSYNFIAKQIAFGPRIPGTAEHKNCSDWLQAKLKEYGATVTTQPFVGVAYNGVKRNSHNIIASINPTAPKRILLAAHWDTRPIADQDTKNKDKPVLGANDGASGVAVALEIARLLHSQPLKATLGVDIIFFDNEDNGTPDNGTHSETDKYDFWCLGSKYWAENKHNPNYSAYFGILLDMVAGQGTYYNRESYSQQYATSIVDLVWSTAAALGYGQYFKNDVGGAITDDHLPVNEIARIPMIDIISSNGQSFGAFWHTHLDDNMTLVSKPNMQAVGQTVLQVIYNEQ